MKPKRVLGIETSSPVFSVAVSEGPHLICCLKVGGQGRPSALLTELFREVLIHAGWELAQVDGLAVSIGPGSFNGLRVGVTTVKTLSWALKKSVLPVSSLEAIASNIPGADFPIAAFLDARKSKVYAALFLPDGSGALKRLTKDQLLLPRDALKKVIAQRGAKGKILLVGDGIRRYGDFLAGFKGKVNLSPEEFWIPSAESVCRIAASRWPQGLVDDPHTLVPQYLYSKESDITGW